MVGVDEDVPAVLDVSRSRASSSPKSTLCGGSAGDRCTPVNVRGMDQGTSPYLPD
jgi:hypothetical protein